MSTTTESSGFVAAAPQSVPAPDLPTNPEALEAQTQQDAWTLYVARLACNPYSPGVAQPMAVCRSWLAYVDPLQLKIFFHSDDLRRSQWRPPEEWDDELATVPPLTILKSKAGRRVYVLRDAECLLQYFVDALTGDAQWRPPDDVRDLVKDGEGADVDWDADVEEIGKEGSRLSSMGDAATVVVKIRLHGLPWVRKPLPGKLGSASMGHAGSWSIYQSKQEATMGLLYYYNTLTSITQWEVPKEVLALDSSAWGPGPASKVVKALAEGGRGRGRLVPHSLWYPRQLRRRHRPRITL